MRKKNVFKTVVTALCVGILIIGCGSAGSSNKKDDSSSDSDDIKIGFSLRTVQEERWQRDLDSVEKWAGEQGVEIITNVANNDSNTQISQIENMVTQGVDAIMVVPVDSTALVTTLDNAHNNGVKILAYDYQISGWVDAMVGYNSYEIGKQIASYVADMKEAGNYVFLYGDATGGDTVQQMVDGFHDAFGDFFEQDGNKLIMEQYCKDWAASEAMAYMENALSTSGNKITGAICMNDGIASGAIQALDAQGLTALVTGQDAELTAIKRIQEGKQTSTLYKDSDSLAKQAVETAIKLVKDEEIESDKTCDYEGSKNTEAPYIVVDAKVITAENIQSEIIDAGVYTEEEINNAEDK